MVTEINPRRAAFLEGFRAGFLVSQVAAAAIDTMPDVATLAHARDLMRSMVGKPEFRLQALAMPVDEIARYSWQSWRRAEQLQGRSVVGLEEEPESET